VYILDILNFNSIFLERINLRNNSQLSYFYLSSFNKLDLQNLFVSQLGSNDDEVGTILNI
jgi:hypothetical protein